MAEAVAAKARSPLAETTNRMNSPYPTLEQNPSKPRYDTSEVIQSRASPAISHTNPENRSSRPASSHAAPGAYVPSVLKPPYATEEDKRFSQASYASSSSSRSKKSYKTHIGPWQLGRTLGKGSSARVRLCRHNVTHQMAAVKIVNRRMAYLVQDSSMAALSKWDSNLPDKINGEMRVPMAIEREVAILKLIEHPNIMKLYDIWENRSEIYLILEYIDQGDLFTFINSRGRLPEEVAICFFRQMMSAISYCHSFNVCHRDLKPENILITNDFQIKIADFGMAALHQTATHHLATACGSPHYAAPELLKNKQYRGERADIWSMGVILYAMLSATLPFDDPDLRAMMAKTKKGQYEMPKFLSPEAEDLIRRMLQVNPDRRITMKEIWAHPLVQKYSYLDDFGDNSAQLPDTRKGFQYTPVSRADIDPQLLRQLRSMWHMFSEHDLVLKLTCEEPTDQKAFYWLLHNYRNKQLEDFKPELAHSMSDYHHLKPAVWKKRISTAQFEKPRANGHGRSISRFTVISNAADTEPETTQPYDPYRGSRMLKHSDSQVSQTRVVVHRDSQVVTISQSGQTTRARSGSNARRMRANSTRGSLTSRPQSSHGSLASLRNTRAGTPQVRAHSLRHKRGVDFSHIRRRSSSAGPRQQNGSRHLGSGAVDSSGHGDTAAARAQSPEMTRAADGTYPKAIGAPSTVHRVSGQSGVSMMFNEELRHFSNNIAKDCDKAFRSSIVEYDSEADSLTDGERKHRESNPFSINLESPTTTVSPMTEASTASWHSRPLPPLPKDTSSQATSALDNDEYATIFEEDNGVAVPVLLSRHVDRRIVSAPAHSQPNRKLSTLPSINENAGMHGDGTRIVSAPPHSRMRQANEKNYGMDYLSRVEQTIRVVNSPISGSPQKVSQNTQTAGERQGDEGFGRALNRQLAYHADDEDDHIYDAETAPRKRMLTWFRRTSKAEFSTESSTKAHRKPSGPTNSKSTQRSDEDLHSEQGKKRNFTFPFWKSNKARESKLSVEGPEEVVEKKRDSKPAVITKRRSALVQSNSGNSRNIEVKQNWLTRLFRVKPATSYLCMTLSSRRARQEVVILLREWRRYGMRGIQVDKERNIIFARLGAKNYLNLKEVDFAVEIMTVIEHGKKQPLSIVRFTQERGAASTLHRIVDTMRIMFQSRHLMVTDKNKRKMMVKTLTS